MSQEQDPVVSARHSEAVKALVAVESGLKLCGWNLPLRDLSTFEVIGTPQTMGLQVHIARGESGVPTIAVQISYGGKELLMRALDLPPMLLVAAWAHIEPALLRLRNLVDSVRQTAKIETPLDIDTLIGRYLELGSPIAD